jgi:antitoxin component YwqK of YwqJK toxin-antitoxin module
MKKLFFAGVMAVSSMVFAQGKAAEVKLACPAESKQVGGPKSALEASVCVKSGRDGSRVFHGPYLAYWQNGIKQAEGQFENGFRSGKWMFFDEKGTKSGETEFKAGDFHGARVEFHENGMKKLEETYVSGRRQGVQTMYDATGKVMTATNFVDDRPVAPASTATKNQ